MDPELVALLNAEVGCLRRDIDRMWEMQARDYERNRETDIDLYRNLVEVRKQAAEDREEVWHMRLRRAEADGAFRLNTVVYFYRTVCAALAAVAGYLLIEGAPWK